MASGPPRTWVYLIRHGEVESADEGRFYGHTDVPLSAGGLAQVDALGARLGEESITAVYSSDLLRARQSAAPLAARLGVEAVAVPELREMAIGRWEGLTFREIREREPDAVTRWMADPVRFAFPDGESLQDLQRRVLPAFAGMVARHPGQRIAVVAHGGSNRVILGAAIGLPLDNILRMAQDYAGWSLVEYRGASAVLHTLNQRLPGAAGIRPVESTAS